MKLASINSGPDAEICKTCPLSGGELSPEIHGAGSYLCTQGNDANGCEVPFLLKSVKEVVTNTSNATWKLLLSKRRALAADKDCKICFGAGQFINAITNITEKCSCH